MQQSDTEIGELVEYADDIVPSNNNYEYCDDVIVLRQQNKALTDEALRLNMIIEQLVLENAQLTGQHAIH
jgi:hypothetical protein